MRRYPTACARPITSRWSDWPWWCCRRCDGSGGRYGRTRSARDAQRCPNWIRASSPSEGQTHTAKEYASTGRGWSGSRTLPLRLRLGGQCGGGPRVQPTQVDRFAGVLAIAIRAVVEPDQRPFDVLQLSLGAFAADDAELAIARRTCLIGLIALADAVICAHRRDRFQFTLGVRTQPQQFLAEIFHLRGIHERLVGGRLVAGRQVHWHVADRGRGWRLQRGSLARLGAACQWRSHHFPAEWQSWRVDGRPGVVGSPSSQSAAA